MNETVVEPKLNIELLKEIQSKIREEPRQFIMHRYFESNYLHIYPNCGTAACIAGWGFTLTRTVTKKPKDAREIWSGGEEEINKIFGITRKIAMSLFFETSWPPQFRGSRPLHERAIARIQHLIDTGE